MSSYAKIMNFGPVVQTSPLNNPLTYCAVSELDNGFLHAAGGNKTIGKYTKPCQMFMSDYCANNWDAICENASRDMTTSFPNEIGNKDNGAFSYGRTNELTAGDILIRNTASKKYLSEASASCALVYEPFDPLTATSPMISQFSPNSGNKCVVLYEVNPRTIDMDPVMNKMLQNPMPCMDILVKIYNNMKRQNKIESLKGTRLYNLFISQQFQYFVQKSGSLN